MSFERKPSLFVQKMQMLRIGQENRNPLQETKSSPTSHINFGERSFVVTGEEATAIHRENVAKLLSMSEEAILEARRELLSNLKPETMNFLRRKRKQSTAELESSFSSLSTNDTFNPDLSVAESALQDNIIELERKGLHMDKLEPEKMKWMEDVPTVPQPLPDSLYSARFDFEGHLLPYVDENKSTCERGLYHHGEEPHRPGYTIEELYQLSRSSVVGQRIIALNTLAAILEKEFVLSFTLETELLKVLLDSGLFLILRFSLDDKLALVHLAALHAISSLFWRPLDMHYLSDMVGIFGDIKLPTLSVNDETLSSNNLNEVKDVDLIKLDVITGALRTDIVQRFKYIMEDPLLEVDHFLYIIRCLTVFCYHSAESVVVVMNTPSLLELLFAYCQYESSQKKLYIPKLMILFRVIACRSEQFACELQKRLNIIPFLLNIMGDIVTKTTTASQCMRLWHVFLHYGIGIDSINDLSPMFFTLLKQLHGLQKANLKSGIISYADTFITLVQFLIERHFDAVRYLVSTIDELCCQWLHIVVNEKIVPREFVKLVANTVYLLTSLPQTSLNAFPAKMKEFLKSAAYHRSTERLNQCSFLLNASKNNFLPSLPSLNVPASILSTSNDLVLVHAAVKYCLAHGNRNLAERLLNEPLWSYVNRVLDHPILVEVSNLWCSRYEIYFLCDIVDLCLEYDIFVDRKLLQLAFVLVRIIAVDDTSRIEKLFTKVIFSDRLYRETMAGRGGDVDAVCRDLESMEQVFARELSLPKSGEHLLMATARGAECALSTDWYYVPILRISNNEGGNVSVDTESIRSVLRWIHLLETIADELKTDMSLAARYCRVACVFMCGDVFLEVCELLYDILRELTKRNDRLDFKGRIPGISSFYDFYRELCEQFVSSSYGNPVFAAYLLVPLQQRHSSELRRHIWSEQPVVFRFLRLTESQLPVSVTCFLEPFETDLNLVETYLRVIATGRIEEKHCPILYRIGLHHVAMFIKKFEGEIAAQKLKQKIESIGNEDIRDKFINYSYDCS